jgi:hypothetical protein
VVLDGAGAGAGVDGLSLSAAAPGSTIRGFVIQLIKGAANNCSDIAVPDYLEVNGEKQHELLFHAHSIDVHRKC